MPTSTPAPVLLVTGGSRGIGAATARLAAARGWDVAINYTRDAAAAEAVAADVRAPAAVPGAAGRRGRRGPGAAMFNAIDRGLGVLGGLVNNAGVVDLPQRVDQMSVARLKRMFAINVIGRWSARARPCGG
jgi:NAD(P)-dependent dehydrogenase (short-subunit alcohol dehydrogenase family)